MRDPLLREFHRAGLLLPEEREPQPPVVVRVAWTKREQLQMACLIAATVLFLTATFSFTWGVAYANGEAFTAYETEQYLHHLTRDRLDEVLTAAERAAAEVEKTQAVLLEAVRYRDVLAETTP